MMLLVAFVSAILTTVHASTLSTIMPSSQAIQMDASSESMINQATMSTAAVSIAAMSTPMNSALISAMSSAMSQSAQNQGSESVAMHQSINSGMTSLAGGMMSTNMINSSMSATPAGGNSGSTIAMQVHSTITTSGNTSAGSTSVIGQASSVMAANSQSSASILASVSPTPANSQVPPSSSVAAGTFGPWTHDCKSNCCSLGWQTNNGTFELTRTCPQASCTADEYHTNTTRTLPCENNCNCSSAALLKLSSFAFALLILSMLQNL